MSRTAAPRLLLCAALVGCAGAGPSRNQSWRNRPPESAAQRAITLPRVSRTSLANGFTTYFVEGRPGVVTVGVSLRDLGAAPAGTGRALLQALAIDRGPTTAAYDVLGGDLDLRIEAEGGVLYVTALPESLDASIEALATILRTPDLTAEAVENTARIAHSERLERADSPSALALAGLREVVFGADSRCAREDPAVEEIDAWTAERLGAAHRRLVGPESTALIVVGDADPARVAAAVERSFGDWADTTKPLPQPPQAEPRPRTAVHVIPRRGLKQTTILLGRVAPPAGSDAAALFTLGAPTVRWELHRRLRQELGVTYGVHAWIHRRQTCPILTIRTDVDGNRTGEALRATLSALDNARRVQRMRADVERSVDHDLLARMRLYESSVQALEHIGSLHWYRLEDGDVIDHERLGRFDTTMIRNTSAELFDPRDLEIILVGDPELIRDQLARLKLGPLVILDPERKP